jgi:hypothetical protein
MTATTTTGAGATAGRKTVTHTRMRSMEDGWFDMVTTSDGAVNETFRARGIRPVPTATRMVDELVEAGYEMVVPAA